MALRNTTLMDTTSNTPTPMRGQPENNPKSSALHTHTLYALECFHDTPAGNSFREGFLFFPNKAKADDFLSMASNTRAYGKKNSYKHVGAVKVGDFIKGKVATQYNFFARSPNNFSLSEPD